MSNIDWPGLLLPQKSPPLRPTSRYPAFSFTPLGKHILSILLTVFAMVSSEVWLSSITVSAQARSTSGSQSSKSSAGRTRLNIDQKWKFVGTDTPGAEQPE